MPITVMRITDEPIIVVTYTDVLDVTLVETVITETAHLMTTVQNDIYRIHDMRAVLHDFRRAGPFVRALRRDVVGSMTDSRMRPIYVGNHPIVRYIVSKLKDVRLNIPIFDTLDDALDHARQQYRRPVVGD